MNKEQELEIKNHLQTLEKDAVIDLYLQKCFDTDVQLAEKDTKISELKQTISKKFMNMKFTDFIKLGLEDGFVVKATSSGNLKVIEELENIKDNFYSFDGIEMLGFIENRIKELKGE